MRCGAGNRQVGLPSQAGFNGNATRVHTFTKDVAFCCIERSKANCFPCPVDQMFRRLLTASARRQRMTREVRVKHHGLCEKKRRGRNRGNHAVNQPVATCGRAPNAFPDRSSTIIFAQCDQPYERQKSTQSGRWVLFGARAAEEGRTLGKTHCAGASRSGQVVRQHLLGCNKLSQG